MMKSISIYSERERERERERETMTGPQTADAHSNALSPVYFWKTGLALFPWYVLFGRVRNLCLHKHKIGFIFASAYSFFFWRYLPVDYCFRYLPSYVGCIG